MCMAFPEVAFKIADTKVWKQLPNPVPSNKMCFHIKHNIICPHCSFGLISEKEKREQFFISKPFSEKILQRDSNTCQACGYTSTEKPRATPKRQESESDAEYLFRRFTSSLASSDKDIRSLAIAHFHRRYDKESYENRHEIENARVLCSECHNAESAKHEMEKWLNKMKTCPWLKSLE